MLYIFLIPVITIIVSICTSIRGLLKGFSEIGMKENPILYPFSVCEYYDRIEKAQLEILEEQKPVESMIILWWGFDGLRLDKDGTLQWISRKKPEAVNQNVFYQPPQSMAMAQIINQLDMRNMCENTRSHIQALQDAERICAMSQISIPSQIPPLPMLYPSAYCDPYKPHFQGNLNGFCCDGSILM